VGDKALKNDNSQICKGYKRKGISEIKDDVRREMKIRRDSAFEQTGRLPQH
jgi:hypothetical protein